VDCIVQWFAHGGSACPNCRFQEEELVMIKRSLSERINAARKRKNTPNHVKILIKRYDQYKHKKKELRQMIKEHKKTHRAVYTNYRRLQKRLRHYSDKEKDLKTNIGIMGIRGVPLSDMYRLCPEASE
jgi:septal ring factor EnvC (AmiA/AmiB activator)